MSKKIHWDFIWLSHHISNIRASQTKDIRLLSVIHEVCSCYILYVWGNIDLERIWTICAWRKADVRQIHKAFVECSVCYYLYKNTESLKDEQHATVLRCCTIQAQKTKRERQTSSVVVVGVEISYDISYKYESMYSQFDKQLLHPTPITKASYLIYNIE